MFFKTLSIFSLTLIIYGYLCRIFGLWFFWESKLLGFLLLLIGIIGLLRNRIKFKKSVSKKTILEKIAIILISITLLIQLILITILPFTDAYVAAKQYLTDNQGLKLEVGNITGFGVILSGGIQKEVDSIGEHGYATINMIVKGDRKYKDLTVYAIKNPEDNEWKIEGTE